MTGSGQSYMYIGRGTCYCTVYISIPCTMVHNYIRGTYIHASRGMYDKYIPLQ